MAENSEDNQSQTRKLLQWLGGRYDQDSPPKPFDYGMDDDPGVLDRSKHKLKRLYRALSRTGKVPDASGNLVPRTPSEHDLNWFRAQAYFLYPMGSWITDGATFGLGVWGIFGSLPFAIAFGFVSGGVRALSANRFQGSYINRNMKSTTSYYTDKAAQQGDDADSDASATETPTYSGKWWSYQILAGFYIPYMIFLLYVENYFFADQAHEWTESIFGKDPGSPALRTGLGKYIGVGFYTVFMDLLFVASNEIYSAASTLASKFDVNRAANDDEKTHKPPLWLRYALHCLNWEIPYFTYQKRKVVFQPGKNQPLSRDDIKNTALVKETYRLQEDAELTKQHYTVLDAVNLLGTISHVLKHILSVVLLVPTVTPAVFYPCMVTAAAFLLVAGSTNAVQTYFFEGAETKENADRIATDHGEPEKMPVVANNDPYQSELYSYTFAKLVKKCLWTQIILHGLDDTLAAQSLYMRLMLASGAGLGAANGVGYGFAFVTVFIWSCVGTHWSEYYEAKNTVNKEIDMLEVKRILESPDAQASQGDDSVEQTKSACRSLLCCV